jgi:hypothetical protein
MKRLLPLLEYEATAYGKKMPVQALLLFVLKQEDFDDGATGLQCLQATMDDLFEAVQQSSTKFPATQEEMDKLTKELIYETKADKADRRQPKQKCAGAACCHNKAGSSGCAHKVSKRGH